MYIVKCANCGYKLTKDNQIMLYGGEKVASMIAIECARCQNLGEKKRKVASLFNQFNVKCPECRKTGEWSWL